MHFGQVKKKLILIFIILIVAQACKQSYNVAQIEFEKPLQGQNLSASTPLVIKLQLAKDLKVTKVIYLLDGKQIALKNNADSMVYDTKDLTMGYKLISAIITSGSNKIDTLNTNIVVKAAAKPVQYGYKLVKTYPHDTSAYTEGLSYVDGKLLESTGEKGNSVLKWVELASGKALQQTKLAPQYFGEGSLKINDKIIMLTWQENIGFVFDAKTLKQVGNFPYQNSREGWGLGFNGKQILRSDGTNRIWFMNAETYKEEGYLEVYDNNGPINNINELEFIDGKIYANVYLTNKIIIINAQSGAVEATVDLTDLVPKNFFKTPEDEGNNVLNGIAWDEQNKRLFVTGKKWPKLFEIKLIKTL